MSNCTFCRIITRQESSNIVYDDKNTLAFLDKYPQTRGHLQLVPKIHVRWIYEIENIGSFFKTAQKVIRAIIPALGASHVTMATFGDEVMHAHLWIVPQYSRTMQTSQGMKRRSLDSLPEVSGILKNALSSI